MTSEPNACSACAACCKSYVVPVCGRDIWLLSTQQRMNPEQFVVTMAFDEQRSDAFRLEAGGKPLTLMLDKKGQMRLNGDCIFLMTLVGGHQRCGVYNDRPVACRAYPMVRFEDEQTHLITIGPRKDALCPPGSWSSSVGAGQQWAQAVQQVDMEFDIYSTVLSRWNARVATYPNRKFQMTEFFSYLMNVYDRMGALDKRLGEDAVNKVRATWRMGNRTAKDLEELRKLSDEFPWVPYLYEVRDIVDDFYPEAAALEPST